MRIVLQAGCLAAGLCAATPAPAAPVTFRYVNGDVIASATLDVEGGLATSGSGTIQGGGLIGTLPMTLLGPGLAPPPLHVSPDTGCGAGGGCYDVGTFSCGCDFVNQDLVFDPGAAIPVDSSGLAFQVGGAALNYGLALYDAGDGTVGEILAGNAAPQPNILIAGRAGGTLTIEPVPEPGSSAALLTAAAALHSARRGRRRRDRSLQPSKIG